MKRPVNDWVNKMWAKSAQRLLTGCHPDVSSLFTHLLTMTSEMQGTAKNEAARERLIRSYNVVVECVRYGWTFGFNGTVHPNNGTGRLANSRRLTALRKPAIAQGAALGNSLRRQVAKHHSTHLKPLEAVNPLPADLQAVANWDDIPA